MTALLEIDSLEKRFGGMVAVNGVSLDVSDGEIVGLIGPNGAGKTTLLNCIAGSNPATRGRIRLAGEDTTRLTADKMCHKGVSRTFQIPRPFPKLTALENVLVAATYGRRRPSGSTALDWAHACLDYVSFPRSAEIPADALNTVELKRLDLARALACGPRLLLLDELASGLTSRELTDLMQTIRQIRDDGMTVVIVEHVMMVIMGLCERLVVLDHGQKIAEGKPEIVARDPNVEEAYLGAKQSG